MEMENRLVAAIVLGGEVAERDVWQRTNRVRTLIVVGYANPHPW